jgi:hypothetical protein
MKISEYTVAAFHSVEGLKKSVNALIRLGWQPVGGASYDGHDYIQAMVKYA